MFVVLASNEGRGGELTLHGQKAFLPSNYLFMALQ